MEVYALLWSLYFPLKGRSVPTNSCSTPSSAKGGVQLVSRTGQVITAKASSFYMRSNQGP